MEPTNRLAAVFAAIDAERERKPRPRKPARKAEPKAERREICMSYLLESAGRLVDFEVYVTTEKPRPSPGWTGPTETPVGWFMTRIVQ